jgi:hypothetical protein
MAPRDEVLTVLQSIDATLKTLVSLSQQRITEARAAKPKPVATDRDLDSRYGDPILKFMPRNWTGDSFKECHFSACPPDLLDMVAESYDWFASQAEAKHEVTDKGKPVADYKRQDAARARGWAKRMRDGTHKPPLVTGSRNGDSSDQWGDGGF